ncbi:MAG: peptide ABC transporter substrate-binding protein [Candidatus Uhrbacteria bacterium]
MFATGALLAIAGISLLVTAWYRNATVIEPTVGGAYIEGLVGEPHLVNPLFATANDVDADIVRLLYSGLLRFDATGALVPDLAERYDISSDGKIITATLRDGIRWHDGALVTIDDVLFTFRLIDNQAVSSPLRASFRGVTVERVDERTVRFTIDRPLAIFLSALTVGILPEHLWTDIPPAHLPLAELNLRPIGNGSFRFVGLTKDKRGAVHSYTLERYADFHGGAPRIERLTFRFFPNTEELLVAFERREVDGIGTFLPLTPEAIRRTDVTKYAVRLPETTAIFLNSKREESLRDITVRQALSLAIDRRAAVTAAFGSAGTLVGGPIIPGFSPAADPPDPDPYDPTRAAELFNAAKWVQTDVATFITTRTQAELRRADAENQKRKQSERQNAEELRAEVETRVRSEVDPDLPYIRTRNGEALAITLTTADVPELIALATNVRDAWHALGVHVTVDTLPIDRIKNETIPSRAYDALLFSQILGPDPDPFPFWHSSQVRYPGLNLSYFSNRAIDRVLEEARAISEHSVRAMRYTEFQRLLAEERPAIFLATPSYSYIMSNAIRGVRTEALTHPADRFNSITEWYTDTKRVWKTR